MAFAIHIDAQRRDAITRHLHVMQLVRPPVQRRFVGFHARSSDSAVSGRKPKQLTQF